MLVVGGVLLLVGVDEGEVELLRVGQGAQRVERGADPHLDPVRDARALEIRPRDLRPVLVDLTREQPPVGTQPAGDADRGVAGERAHLERPAGADRPHQQGEERALVGRDLHHGHVAERLGLPGELREDVVLARPVLDQVGVQLVVERRVLGRHYPSRGPSAWAANPAPRPTSPPASPAHSFAESSTSGSASSTAANTISPTRS